MNTRSRSHSEARQVTPSQLVFAVTIWLSVIGATTSRAHEQQTRANEIAETKAAKADHLEAPTKERGEIIFERLENLLRVQPPDFGLALDSIRSGGGFAPGAVYYQPLGRVGLWSVKGQWSIANFKLVETALKFDRLARGRLDATATARWEDAPDLSYFGSASSSTANGDGSYALRTRSVGAGADVRLARRVALRASAEYLDVTSDNGAGTPAVDDVFTPVSAPGLGSNPSWLHGTASLDFDSRESAGYTRRGGLYRATFHAYRDQHDNYSFRMLDLDARQFVPVLNENWIIAVQANTQLTDHDAGQTIPYFMLPYAGGGSTLRGFRQYRFADRHRLLLRGELRWTPSRVLDMAVFADNGKTFADRRDIDFDNLETAWGIGARFHGPTFTALRLEAARGREGWRFHVASSPSF